MDNSKKDELIKLAKLTSVAVSAFGISSALTGVAGGAMLHHMQAQHEAKMKEIRSHLAKIQSEINIYKESLNRLNKNTEEIMKKIDTKSKELAGLRGQLREFNEIHENINQDCYEIKKAINSAEKDIYEIRVKYKQTSKFKVG